MSRGAQMALDSGEALEAAQLLERLLRQVPAHRPLDRAPALDVLVHARIACGNPDAAAAALADLRQAERLIGSLPLLACGDLAEGVLAAALHDHERARPLLEDAVDRFEESGAPFESARARLALAESLRALGRADAARREATLALERLLELGAESEAERARHVLVSIAGDEGAASRAVTRRERDVLRLLVEGLTNRQIADRLVLSEHTVHRHVSNILRKLDLPSRTAAATHAVRSGLVDDPGA